MRYLAIDYGLRRVGLAMCDPGEIIISPLCQLPHDKTRITQLIAKISDIISENRVEAVVVGWPLNMDDTEGPQAKLTREFSEHLAHAIDIPVHLQDERLSSAAADEMMQDAGLTTGRKKQRRDMLAACDILRGFLDQLGCGSAPPNDADADADPDANADTEK